MASEQTKKAIGNSLRKMRETNKLSQSDAALYTGLSQGNLSRWENGHVTPDYDSLAALAALYGTQPGELLPKVEEPVPGETFEQRAQRVARNVKNRHFGY